jgi:hypothetical protein
VSTNAPPPPPSPTPAPSASGSSGPTTAGANLPGPKPQPLPTPTPPPPDKNVLKRPVSATPRATARIGARTAPPAAATPAGAATPTPTPTPTPAPTGQPGSKTNPITQAQAETLVKDFAAKVATIPFDYPRNFCFARAHEMYRELKARGIEAGKAWNYSSKFEQGGATLSVKTHFDTTGSVSWRYHVAPVVWAKDASGVPHQMVIDPSMSKDKPILATEWQSRQSDPKSRLEFSQGSTYFKEPDHLPDGKPAPHPVPPIKDDSFTETKKDLDKARHERDELKHDHPELWK